MRRLLHHPFVKRHLSVAAVLRALRQPVFLTLVFFWLGLWGFSALAEAVDEGATRRFDDAILQALREPGDPRSLRGPAWVEHTLRDFTALGGEPVLALITTIVVLYFAFSGRHDLSLFTLFAIVGGTVLTFALKGAFGRARPDLVPYILVSASSGSFPSGHAMGSAFVYLTLGAILAEVAPTRLVKAYVFSVAALLTLLIGATRVFLGVHFPTDVLAGWAAGCLWAYACRSALRLARFVWGFRRAKENLRVGGSGTAAVDSRVSERVRG